MKHKRLDRDAWGFWHFPYYQLRVDTEDFHGLACLLRIPGGDYYYWEMPKAGRLAVCGEGMTWLELIPDGEHRVVTAKYFPDGKPGPERENYPSFVNKQYPVSVWYAVVIEGMEDAEDGVAVFIDKYLDKFFDLLDESSDLLYGTVPFTDNMKREAYERQNGICTNCGEHFEIGEMAADHITPWSQGGKTLAENCQMLCRDCNRRKSDR